MPIKYQDSGSEVVEGTDILVRKAPNLLHRKIERYIEIVAFKESRQLLKPEAIVELLEKATKNVKLK